ncbi:MAG: hypothetical protein JW940_11600 [Polyangiaceae bacterium]|nr:hypothetical protein [Polyangiaceae bacterium]
MTKVFATVAGLLLVRTGILGFCGRLRADLYGLELLVASVLTAACFVLVALAWRIVEPRETEMPWLSPLATDQRASALLARRERRRPASELACDAGDCAGTAVFPSLIGGCHSRAGDARPTGVTSD